MMLRKAQLLVLPLGIFLTSNANAVFYVGKGFGSDFVNFKQSSHVSKPGVFDVVDTTQLASTGFFGSLYLGLSKINYKHWYTAVELNGTINSSVFKRSNDEYLYQNFLDSSYKINNTWSISLLPGFQFTPDTLVYGRIGYANGHFISRSTDPSLENLSQCMDGIRYGIGVTRSFTEQADFRFDYSLTNYKNVEFTTFDPISNVTKTTKVTPLQQLVELSLVYRFN